MTKNYPLRGSGTLPETPPTPTPTFGTHDGTRGVVARGQ